MARQPKPVKPLIKHYKAALLFLVKDRFELKLTKSGMLSLESIGYLKGYFDQSTCNSNQQLGVQMSVIDLVEMIIDSYGYKISATNLALWFRNEEAMLKLDEQRVEVVQSFMAEFGENLVEDLIDECNADVEADEIEDEAECVRLADEADYYGAYDISTPDYEEEEFEPLTQAQNDAHMEFIQSMFSQGF